VRPWLAQSDCGRGHIAGTVTPAHPECGNGVTWSLNVRRGTTRRQLAAAKRMARRSEGWAIRWCFGACRTAFAIDRPVQRDHSCDLTAIELEIATRRATPNGYGTCPTMIGRRAGRIRMRIDWATQKCGTFTPSPMSAQCRPPFPLDLSSKMAYGKERERAAGIGARCPEIVDERSGGGEG